jgi:hypothetical protein
MAIYKGSTKIKSVYFGGTKIGKIYKGNQLVYQSKSSPKYLCYYSEHFIGTGSLPGYDYCKYPATVNSAVFWDTETLGFGPSKNSSTLTPKEHYTFKSFSGNTAVIDTSTGTYTATRSPENDLYE